MWAWVASAATSYLQGRKAKRNAQDARNHANAWSANMSNTAVQRRMKDMEKAGINPILAGKYDASTPAASAMDIAGAESQGMTAGSTMASTAAGVGQAEAAIQKINQEVENLGVQKEILEIDKLIKGDQQKFWKNVGILNQKITNLVDKLEPIVDDVSQTSTDVGSKFHEILQDLQDAAKSVNNYGSSEGQQFLDGIKTLWDRFTRHLKTKLW